MEIARNHEDRELVNALKDRKTMNEAIGSMYRSYYRILENYILNNKGTKDDAADIIQETIVAFIDIVQQDKYRGDSSIQTFLYAITRNLWLSEIKKRSSTENRNRIFEKGRDNIERESVQHLIHNEYSKTIQDLFARLGDKCKQLLMLVYFEDLSMKDILEAMPDYNNEQVLRNKKYKCMKQLEQMISDNETLRTQFKNALKHAG